MKKLICFIAASLLALSAMAQSSVTSVIEKLADRFAFRGYVQLGWEYHDQSDPNNEFKLNKLIIMSDLRITERWNAFAMFDFKGFTLQEVWTSYRVQPWLSVKVGQFKTPFTIESPLSPSILETVTLTSLATNHMVMGSSNTMMPASAGRDIGITLCGDAGRYVSYDLALTNGAGRGKSDDNSWKDFTARLTLHPIQVLDISASTILGKGATKLLDDAHRQRVWADKQEQKDFCRNRFAVGAYLRTAPIDVRAEWMWGRDGECDSNGGYMTARVKDLAVKGLDLVASYDHLNAFDTTDRYQAGVQYWFYSKCRLQLSYAHTKTKGLGGENAILTQIQVGF